MTKVNDFFAAPLSIHRPYLMSVAAAFFADFQYQKITPADLNEADYTTRLATQAERNADTGATSFPVIMTISGPIVKYSTWNQIGTQHYIKVLKSLEMDSRISGVILNIDSGGGMSSGTGELSDVIRNFSKPTAAFTNGLMASAAYNIASGADLIVSDPNADIIGSIGSYISYLDLMPIWEKYGAKLYEQYAPQSDLKNKGWRDWLSGDSKAIEKELEEYTASFIARMKRNRGETLKDDGKVFRGEVYTPEKAKSIGLIDEVNTLEWLIEQF